MSPSGSMADTLVAGAPDTSSGTADTSDTRYLLPADAYHSAD